MLNWSRRFGILLFLDSNGYQSPYGRYECLCAVGAVNRYDLADFDGLYTFHKQHQDWLFGHLSYDLKNNLEPKLASAHPEHQGFPLLHFFQPEIVCFIASGERFLAIESLSLPPEEIYAAILAVKEIEEDIPSLEFKQRISKEAYQERVAALRKHIYDGDCYEINFCAEGFAEDAAIDPFLIFQALNKLSPAPFAAFYRLDDRYLMCASPERYLQKSGNRILSQPIKGTAKRGNTAAEDEVAKKALQESSKERAENVMIVDLVRNDLARSCEVGSVSVDELFGIQSFPQVHQMVSTVSGTLKTGLPFTEAIRHSFPMGSMTGAPKVKVMELVEQYEVSRRELYSGSVGYITPGGDFDFNVVIRSLFYNAASRYLSYQTGGAITYDSQPQQEWEERLLKAWALERIFSGKDL